LNTTLLGPGRDLLGESPLWDGREQALYWVDSRQCRVQRWRAGQAVQSWATPSQVGSIALAQPGSLLLALEAGFAWLDLHSGATEMIAPVAHPEPAMRLNDGRTDREGRFLCGSMVLHRRAADGALYRLELDGRVTPLVQGIGVANATCTSPDGRTLYSGDSLAGVIRAWDYAVDGSLSNERVFADTRLQGSGPDGASVDAEGCLWVALVLAAKLARYAPDGRLLRTLDVPVPYPTCPCFGGPDLQTLYVTSIRDTGNLLKSEHPDAGALVEIKGLGVRGLPEVPFAGTALLRAGA
jgi:L-arabinonolactonase